MLRGVRPFRTVLAALIALLVTPGTASATFPGENGLITFTTSGDGPGDVWVVDPDDPTAEPFNVTETEGETEQQAAFSTTGDRIAYRAFDGENWEIFEIDPGGGEPRQITKTASIFENANPVYNASGRIFYDSLYPEDPEDPFSGRSELFAVTVESPGAVTQTTDTLYHLEYQPDIRPDGERIAYVRNSCDENDNPPPNFTCTGYEIWSAVLVGTQIGQEAQLTDATWAAIEPSWSPDGTKIAYTVSDSSGLSDVWVMDADGSDETQLTTTPSVGEGAPVWSPDGEQIAYMKGGEIAVQAPTPGAAATFVTNIPGSRDAYDPSWAPRPSFNLKTFITKRPPAVVRKRTVAFSYRAEPTFGVGFQCKLDRQRFELCNTGRQKFFGLKNGEHTFQVRATDGTRRDPTPAKDTFRVRVPRGRGGEG